MTIDFSSMSCVVLIVRHNSTETEVRSIKVEAPLSSAAPPTVGSRCEVCGGYTSREHSVNLHFYVIYVHLGLRGCVCKFRQISEANLSALMSTHSSPVAGVPLEVVTCPHELKPFPPSARGPHTGSTLVAPRVHLQPLL